MKINEIITEDRYTDDEKKAKASGEGAGERGQNRKNNAANRRAGMSDAAQKKWKSLQAAFGQMSPQEKKDFQADKPTWRKIKAMQAKAGKSEGDWNALNKAIMSLNINNPEKVQGKKDEGKEIRAAWEKTISPVAGMEPGEIKSLGKKLNAAIRKQAYKDARAIIAQGRTVVAGARKDSDRDAEDQQNRDQVPERDRKRAVNESAKSACKVCGCDNCDCKDCKCDPCKCADCKKKKAEKKGAIKESTLFEFREMDDRQLAQAEKTIAALKAKGQKLEGKDKANFDKQMAANMKKFESAKRKKSGGQMNKAIVALNSMKDRYEGNAIGIGQHRIS